MFGWSREFKPHQFERTRPDGVVVGTQYNRGTGHPPKRADHHEHPYVENWYSKSPSEHALKFAGKLRACGFRVFLSTRCVTAWHNASEHGLLVHDRHPHQPALYGTDIGSGVGGLATVRELVLALGGTAVVRADADGGGKSIWITLPL